MKKSSLRIGVLSTIVLGTTFIPHSPVFAQQNLRGVNIVWSTTPIKAGLTNDLIDEQMVFTCPPNGSVSKVFGTGVYTNDSSICSAAVHSGVINIRNGGVVIVNFEAGQNSYTGTSRNGVSSMNDGASPMSFSFDNARNLRGITTDWNTQGSALNGFANQQVVLTCPANGSVAKVFGTDVYSEDSSICTAAVHSGIINTANGGVIIVNMEPGQNSYSASNRNGISSFNDGRSQSSFSFANARTNQGNPGQGNNPNTPNTGNTATTTIGWNTTAEDKSQFINQQFTFNCPGNGVIKKVWGTGVYTDDSSICSAAVHSNLITLQRGGDVTILMKPGQNSYRGTSSNGVVSRNEGSAPASFSFLVQTQPPNNQTGQTNPNQPSLGDAFKTIIDTLFK